MTNRTRCSCAHCACRGLMWPAILITLGVLFLLDQWKGESFSFIHYTWPVLLLVIGAVKLAESMASTAGHIAGPPAPGQSQ